MDSLDFRLTYTVFQIRVGSIHRFENMIKQGCVGRDWATCVLYRVWENGAFLGPTVRQWSYRSVSAWVRENNLSRPFFSVTSRGKIFSSLWSRCKYISRDGLRKTTVKTVKLYVFMNLFPLEHFLNHFLRRRSHKSHYQRLHIIIWK